jgi:hypothetical protein
MINYPNLIPECNIDTAFVEMLGYSAPNHAPSIHQVCSILKKQKANNLCIGFIDDDKKKPDYISGFILLHKLTHFLILKHSSLNQYLIIAKPAMDRVIFDLCQDLNIDLSKYGFPQNFDAFLAQTKRESIKTNKNFKNLLNTIKQRNPPDIEKIKTFISKYV